MIDYLLALHRIWGLHLNKYYRSLFKAFGSWEEVWLAGKAPEWLEIPDYLWERLQTEKRCLDPRRLEEEMAKKGISYLTRDDLRFSGLLLQIANVPCILYYCGILDLLKQISLAVVGARKATAYGLKQARSLSGELAKHGLTIVSGLARGIDAAAHEGALEVGGHTIAVLGCGLDICYPRENIRLLQKIKESGLAISEYPPGTGPLSHNFPIRNRIISGISQAVFVVEARAKSGSLITCDYALEQGKDIFALPGPVTSPNSIGTLRLIQNGAKLVIHAGDILEELGYTFQDSLLSERKEMTKSVSKSEEKVLELIGWEPVHIDTLLSKAISATTTVYQELLQLEIKGLIKQLPGKYYVRI